jgi:hypothetical protein
MSIPMALMTVTQLLAAHGEARSIANQATAWTAYDDLTEELRRRARAGDQEAADGLAAAPGTAEYESAEEAHRLTAHERRWSPEGQAAYDRSLVGHLERADALAQAARRTGPRHAAPGRLTSAARRAIRRLLRARPGESHGDPLPPPQGTRAFELVREDGLWRVRGPAVEGFMARTWGPAYAPSGGAPTPSMALTRSLTGSGGRRAGRAKSVTRA